MLVFMQDLSSGGWICREKLSIAVIIAGFNSLFSRADRIREEGVIGLHALCIISYREEDYEWERERPVVQGGERREC